MSYDAQYYRYAEAPNKGRSEGWVVDNTYATEAEALAACITGSYAFGKRPRWRVVSPDAEILWTIQHMLGSSVVTLTKRF